VQLLLFVRFKFFIGIVQGERLFWAQTSLARVVSFIFVLEFGFDRGIMMKPFHEHMPEYRKLVERGDIKEAYRG